MVSQCLQYVTDAQFGQEVLRESKPVLIDFHTAWCPPCNAMNPTLEALCTELQDVVKIVKLDVEENMATARLHRIDTVPTFVLYRDGKIVAQISGAKGKKPFEAWIRSSLAS